MRELISSFVNTLCRWYSTVRGLMNSCAPISGFEWPSRASSSDLGLLRGELIACVCCAFAHRLAGGRQLAARTLGKSLGSHVAEHLVGAPQLLARIHPSVLAAQPLAVEQVGASELEADAGAAKPLDRLTVEVLGGLAVAEQRSGARLDAQRPVGAAGACRLREPLQGVVGALSPSAAGGRLDELGHDK